MEKNIKHQDELLRTVMHRVAEDTERMSLSDDFADRLIQRIKQEEAAKVGSFHQQVERFEASLIFRALKETGSLRKAARMLQMDPATLLRRKKKYEDMGLFFQE